MRSLALLVTLGFLMTAAAGCLELNQDQTSSHPVRRSGTPPTFAPPAAGNMTGQKAGEQMTSALCTNGVSVPPSQTYCAKKMIWIQGTESGLPELPVTLSTFAGGVNVHGADGNEWNLTVTLQATGDSDANARTNINNIDFQWSHMEGVGHHLKASAKKINQQSQNRESAMLDLKIPRSLELFLRGTASSGGVDAVDIKGSQVTLESSSGGVSVKRVDAVWINLATASGGVDATDFVAQDLQAEASSGGVTLKGKADQIVAQTASGGIDAIVTAITARLSASSGGVDVKFTPAATGSLQAHSTSGSVSVKVPEGTQYGYSVDASTTSGSADITLKDGQTTGKNTAKHFISSNYSKRTIRCEIEAETTSGGTDVGPA